MLQLASPFEDQHGVVHQNAVLVVNHVYVRNESSVAINIHLDENFNPKETRTPSELKSLGFNGWLFSSLAAMKSGKQPISFRLPDGREHFQMGIPEGFDIANGDIVQLCENYLKELTEPVEANIE